MALFKNKFSKTGIFRFNGTIYKYYDGIFQTKEQTLIEYLDKNDNFIRVDADAIEPPVDEPATDETIETKRVNKKRK